MFLWRNSFDDVLTASEGHDDFSSPAFVINVLCSDMLNTNL